MDLAEVLRQTDKTKEAAAYVHGALELYGRKGNIVSARTAMEHLADLDERTAASHEAATKVAIAILI